MVWFSQVTGVSLISKVVAGPGCGSGVPVSVSVSPAVLLVMERTVPLVSLEEQEASPSVRAAAKPTGNSLRSLIGGSFDG